MCPVVFLLTFTGNMLVSYWPMFFLSLVTVPEVFAKVNSTQFSSHIFSSQWRLLVEHIVATLFRMIKTWFQHCNTVLH